MFPLGHIDRIEMSTNPLTDPNQSKYGFSSHMAYENIICNQIEIINKPLDSR